MLKSSVTGLRELAATLRQDRLMEKLKEDNLRFKAKSDESMRRATSIERNDLDVLVFIPLTLPSLFLFSSLLRGNIPSPPIPHANIYPNNPPMSTLII